MQVTTVGLDLAKDVFQVHGVAHDGAVIFNRPIRRRQALAFFRKLPACLVGIEACGSAHHWARELRAIGHDVRLMPPSYVKPYVKRGKTDAVDAEAICEAVTRPTMRFVPVKSADQQAVLAMHRTRALFVRQKTQVLNMVRGLLREFGHVVGNGPVAAMRLIKACQAGGLNRSGFPGGPNFWKDGVHGDEETDEAVPGGAARSRRPAGARARSRAWVAVGGDPLDCGKGRLQR